MPELLLFTAFELRFTLPDVDLETAPELLFVEELRIFPERDVLEELPLLTEEPELRVLELRSEESDVLLSEVLERTVLLPLDVPERASRVTLLRVLLLV